MPNDKVRELAREIANKFAGSPSWAEEPIERILREALRPLLAASGKLSDRVLDCSGDCPQSVNLLNRSLRDELAGWKGEAARATAEGAMR